MEHALKRLEFFRPDVGGHLITPEPESHRPYAPGDDPRYMDWSLYARLDRFYLKTVVSEKEGVLRLLVDVSSSMREPYPQKLEQAMQVAGALAYLSLVAGNRVSVYSWAESVLGSWNFDRGERDAMTALGTLSSLPEGNLTVLEGTLEHIMTDGRNGPSRMVIISDLIDRSRYWPILERVVDTGSAVAAIQVLHTKELDPPLRGKVLMFDPETGASRQQLVGYRDRLAIKAGIEEFFEDTRTALSNMGIPLIDCSAEGPFEDPVRRLVGSPNWKSRRW
jgi:uncharacterized protein (DUF58 family)